ncbi:MAG: hypothetical protein JW891_11905 [Candidatus Lokiarchaeota archaeon]|nr:hypothetical protein [Candidatus Lokiarchaeota archaeon]
MSDHRRLHFQSDTICSDASCARPGVVCLASFDRGATPRREGQEIQYYNYEDLIVNKSSCVYNDIENFGFLANDSHNWT